MLTAGRKLFFWSDRLSVPRLHLVNEIWDWTLNLPFEVKPNPFSFRSIFSRSPSSIFPRSPQLFRTHRLQRRKWRVRSCNPVLILGYFLLRKRALGAIVPQIEFRQGKASAYVDINIASFSCALLLQVFWWVIWIRWNWLPRLAWYSTWCLKYCQASVWKCLLFCFSKFSLLF